MKNSESLFINVRGLRYHCRCWGAADRPKLFLLHGWMDVSASFQFVVDAFEREWCVIAPDWRGNGLTAWSGADSYWIPDYLGDLDGLLSYFEPRQPVRLLGHSLGANVASIYAGVRPERVTELVNVEGLGLPAAHPQRAPSRYAQWLSELNRPIRLRSYTSFEQLAARLMDDNPRLSPERASFLAQHWGKEVADGVELRSDPAHKRVNPVSYQLDEAKACWRNISARVLWIEGSASDLAQRLGIDRSDMAARKACFHDLTAHSLANAGHMAHHDQPDALARLVEGFLAYSA